MSSASPIAVARPRAPARRASTAWQDWAAARHWLPSWLFSLVLHTAAMILCALLLRVAPQGAASTATDTTGIVLLAQEDDAGGREYFDDEAEPAPASISVVAAPSTAEAVIDRPPVDPSGALPAVELPGAATMVGSESAGEFGAQPIGRGAGRGSGLADALGSGAARTTVFGLAGEGYKFVYVFDRSGSMGGSGRNALSVAKAELLASLDSLQEIHQFQIIFYNDHPTLMPIARQPGALVFGTAVNREQARKFIGSIVADGATRHEEALTAALKMSPDVIFFLTDADEPALSKGQLARIRRLNGGRTSINAIEFGLGPPLGDRNFIMQLAEQNSGRYKYVDVSKQGSQP